MTVRFDQLLQQWYPRREDGCGWVLATIVSTERSTYRKAGSMILIDGQGASYGMLSGGCVEADIRHQARKTFFAQKPLVADYDMREDSDETWQSSLGCGGVMRVLFQPINFANGYLGLERLHLGLQEKQGAFLYRQRLDVFGLNDASAGLSNAFWQLQALDETASIQLPNASASHSHTRPQSASVIKHKGETWLQSVVRASPCLNIFGGGLDAIPLARLAREIGWQVQVIDKRVGYAREHDFIGARTFTLNPTDKAFAAQLVPAQAAVLMAHNVQMDAEALLYCHLMQPEFIGVLGPMHRREKVEQLAGLRESDFNGVYVGPVGEDIGACLPETIALSILAQCHKAVEGQRTLLSGNTVKTYTAKSQARTA